MNIHSRLNECLNVAAGCTTGCNVYTDLETTAQPLYLHSIIASSDSELLVAFRSLGLFGHWHDTDRRPQTKDRR